MASNDNNMLTIHNNPNENLLQILVPCIVKEFNRADLNSIEDCLFASKSQNTDVLRGET